MPMPHSVDPRKLEEFRQFLEQNPDKGMLHLEATATYEGQAGRSLARIGPFAIDDQRIDRDTRQYTIPFGAWREVEEMSGIEGAADRMEPVETTLAALAACLNVSITYNAARLGLKLEGLETAIKTTVDPRVLFMLQGPEQHPACVKNLQFQIKATGDLSDQDLETIKQLAEHSPVHGLLSFANKISGQVARG